MIDRAASAQARSAARGRLTPLADGSPPFIFAAAAWMSAHTELIRRGAAWVGVSTQQIGVSGGTSVLGPTSPGLVGIDPARYGPLPVHDGLLVYARPAAAAPLDDDGDPSAEFRGGPATATPRGQLPMLTATPMCPRHRPRINHAKCP